MTVLDSFYILFKSNAKDAKKDINEAKAAVKDFDKGINDANKSTEELGKSFQKAIDKGIAAIATYISLGAIKNGVLSTAAYNAELQKQTQLTGENAREISVWDKALQQVGGTQGQFISWFSAYASKLQEAGLGDHIKNILPNLREFSEQIKNLDQQTAISLGDKLGIPPELVLLLKNGNAELQRTIDLVGQYDNTTQQTAQEGREFQKELQNLGSLGHSVFNNLQGPAIGFLKVLETVLFVVNKVAQSIDVLFHKIPEWAGGKIGNFLGHLIYGTPTNLQNNEAFPVPLYPGDVVGSGASSATASSSGLPRGIRNNNPGNLRNWAGAPTAGGYAYFASLQEGLQKEQTQLGLYGQRGINTIAAIAQKWAPRNENDTAAYIAGLSKTTGFGPNQPLNLNDPNIRAIVANAINKQEDGVAYGNLIASGADSSPFNGSSANNNSTKSLSIGQVTVNTQATDANGIAAAMKDSLNQHFQTTIGNYDDGIAY